MIYKAGYVLPIAGDPIADGEVLVRDAIIQAVGTNLSSTHSHELVRDLGPNSVLLPGFVNAHSHIDATLRRNTGDGLNLWDWLDRISFGLGRPTPEPDVFTASAMLGALECALSGITCLGDCTFSGASVQALETVGLRGVAYREIFGQSMGSHYPEKFAQVLDQVMGMRSRCSERVQVGISPHSIYTSNREVLELCAEAYTDLRIPLALHLAETRAEAEYTLVGGGPIADMRKRLGRSPMVSGLTPVRYASDVGLLRKGVCLAHCVHISDDEVGLIASSGARVIHCARSNARLGAGIAPVNRFLGLRINVALGTDGVGSCGTLDFFEEMRFALALQRARAEDAGVLTAKDVLRMATSGGARALGLEHTIGTLEAGKRADMIALDLSRALPVEDLEPAVVACSSSDVIMTMVDGVVIAREGLCERVDVAECEAKVREGLERLGLG